MVSEEANLSTSHGTGFTSSRTFKHQKSSFSRLGFINDVSRCRRRASKSPAVEHPGARSSPLTLSFKFGQDRPDQV
ncbi:hypothetical protein RRG08_032356 [Elysia crispata]|uniref:Uncharacterized protein n=1 Tax=Elysia crispata TaxID=231223 RepID=A0AAE1AGA0_9GAST|nr:hypothetical protein RRG08_032356 [Elysia crispata]